MQMECLFRIMLGWPRKDFLCIHHAFVPITRPHSANCTLISGLDLLPEDS